MIAGVVLAAGAATRFGAPKQLAELDGRPLLEHALRAMEDARSLDALVVVLGAHADVVEPSVELGAFTAVRCPAWRDGPSASLRCAVSSLGEDVEAVVVTLGDQPRLTGAVITRFAELAAEDPAAALARATYDGRPGHPALLGRDALARLGDVDRPGALLDRSDVVHVACDELGSDADVDVPADLDELRR